MNTKQVGNIGEAAILSKLIEYGVSVYIPFGDNEKADLVADFNGKLVRIQVKTSIATGDSSYSFSTQSCTSQHFSMGYSSAHIYSENEVDYFCFYNIERKKCLIVPFHECPDRRIAFRYEQTLNGQVKGVRMEEDYSLDTFLFNLSNPI